MPLHHFSFRPLIAFAGVIAALLLGRTLLYAIVHAAIREDRKNRP